MNRTPTLEDKCVFHLQRDAGFYIALHSSKHAKDLEESVQQTLNFFQALAATKDIRALLRIEALCLENNLQRPLSLNDASSLKAGLRQCNKAVEIFDHMQRSPEIYKKLPDSLSEKQIKGGLPLDGVRVFIESHAARLRNIQPLLPEVEKDLMEQRREHLNIIRTVYIDMQKAVLGISPPPDTTLKERQMGEAKNLLKDTVLPK